MYVLALSVVYYEQCESDARQSIGLLVLTARDGQAFLRVCLELCCIHGVNDGTVW